MGADEGTKPSREGKGGLREETTINQSMRENAITKHIALYANFQSTSRTEDVAELVDVCLPCSSPWVLSTAQHKQVWCTPIILALGRWKQKFKIILSYMLSLGLVWAK